MYYRFVPRLGNFLGWLHRFVPRPGTKIPQPGNFLEKLHKLNLQRTHADYNSISKNAFTDVQPDL